MTSENKGILSVDEMVAVMLKEACAFVEFYSPEELAYWREYGYQGPNPIRFHPALGDKLIIKKVMRGFKLIIKKVMRGFIEINHLPDERRCEHNAHRYAQQALLEFFYPIYTSKENQIPEQD